MISDADLPESVRRRLEELTRRAEEAEETLRAIRGGEVDALVVGVGEAAHVFTREGADHAHRMLLEAMNEGALTLAADGTILYANLRFAGLVGAPHERVVGVSFASFVHDPDRRRLQELLQQRHDQPCRADLALCGPKGALVFCVISMSPVAMDGISSTWAVVVTDVTLERRRAEDDLSEVRALQAQLLRSEKLATVGVLAAGIAHEIGTPLGVVRGRAEYVLGKLGLGHAQARGMQVIIEQIDHVTGTLRQLLDFSRVKRAVVRSVAVSAVVRTVLELLRLQTQQRRISTFNEVSDTLPDVAADPDQLQQVLVNLVMNACDACTQGGRVTIRGRLEDAPTPAGWRGVRIEVDDDGCGIPEQNRNQVFDPFFTTKKRGAGSGLGLSVVAQIVRNHRGEIELESEPGRGTRVKLLWPTASSPLEEHHGDAA